MALYMRAETAARLKAAVRVAAVITAAAAAVETMMVEAAVAAVPVLEIPCQAAQGQLRATAAIMTVVLPVMEVRLVLAAARVAMATLAAS